MSHRHSLWTLLFPGAHLCKRLTLLEARFMSDIDELRTTIASTTDDPPTEAPPTETPPVEEPDPDVPAEGHV